eukprot:scaffold2979_cov243-Pinguiococcus_pyrenoidosus.AAC.2
MLCADTQAPTSSATSEGSGRFTMTRRWRWRSDEKPSYSIHSSTAFVVTSRSLGLEDCARGSSLV